MSNSENVKANDKAKDMEEIKQNVCDAEFVEKLAAVLDQTNLTSLEYECEACRIHLKRECKEAAMPIYTQAPVAMPAAAPVMSQSSVAPAVEKAATAEVDYSNSADAVKSPMVGVVYLSSDPNSSNYVNVGDTVAAGDTVCLIEAMKTFNPVKAHKGGKVSKILVESGDPVEYGAPLIVIE